MSTLQEMLGADSGAERDVIALASAWKLTSEAEDGSEAQAPLLNSLDAAILITMHKLRDAERGLGIAVKRSAVHVQLERIYWDAKARFFISRYETFESAYKRAKRDAQAERIAELRSELELLEAERISEETITQDELELTKALFN
jgi:hypothetical protein